MTTEEEWKPIKNFEKRYLISNRGNVKSLGRIMVAKDGYTRIYKDKLLKLTPHKTRGYTNVRLYYENGKNYEHWEVHRLVALHFLPNPSHLPVVNHIDQVRWNNNVRNLEWVTVFTNVTYKGCHLKAGERRKKKVYQYSLDGQFLRAWNSVAEAEELGGYNKNSIRKVCLKLRRTHKNHLWTY